MAERCLQCRNTAARQREAAWFAKAARSIMTEKQANWANRTVWFQQESAVAYRECRKSVLLIQAEGCKCDD